MDEREVIVGRSALHNRMKLMKEWAEIFAHQEICPSPNTNMFELFESMLDAAEKHLVYPRGKRIADALNEAAHLLAFDVDADPERAMLAGAILEKARDIAHSINEDSEDDFFS